MTQGTGFLLTSSLGTCVDRVAVRGAEKPQGGR